jgi:cell division protein FtsZ
MEELSKEVDALIAIPNDRLLQIIGKNTSVSQAFAMCDEILLQAVEGISELITTPGVITVDFADIRAVLEDAGSALMGIGVASGENRATEAAKAAINSPLLDISIEGARGVLFAVSGGDDLSMMEIQEAAQVITESIDPEAKVIFGTIHDTRLKKGQVKITVIASGFGGTQAAPKRKGLFAAELKPSTEPASKPVPSIMQTQTLSPANDLGVVMNRNSSNISKKEEPEEDDSWAMPAFLRRKK